MEIITHNDSCIVGATLMDRQHQLIFRHMDRLYHALEEGAEAPSTMEVYYELSRHMKAHKRDEEEMLRTLEYPHLKFHREHHFDLLSELRHLGDTLSRSVEASRQTVRVLKDKYLCHILQEDKRYGDFLEMVSSTIIF